MFSSPFFRYALLHCTFLFCASPVFMFFLTLDTLRLIHKKPTSTPYVTFPQLRRDDAPHLPDSSRKSTSRFKKGWHFLFLLLTWKWLGQPGRNVVPCNTDCWWGQKKSISNEYPARTYSEKPYLCTSRKMGESISTIQHSAKKHVVQICRSSLSAAADGLADGSGERWTSPFNGDAQSGNGIERSLSRVVVPPSLPVSATKFPTALSVYIGQGACERISALPASCSQRQNCFHSKRKKNINLVYSFCLKHANEMVLGDPWQAYQRTQSLHFPSLFNHSTIACCSSAQTPSSLSI